MHVLDFPFSFLLLLPPTTAFLFGEGVPRLSPSDVGLFDHDGFAVSLFQNVTDDAHVRRCSPTGLQLAATGHAVAFAPDLHVPDDGLGTNFKQTI